MTAPRPIMIVDDSSRDIELFEIACETGGFPVLVRAHVEGSAAMEDLAACAAAGETLPTVIFLDLNMPGVNGFEVLAFLKQHPTLRSLPVYILTTSNSPKDRERCAGMGADRYLVKPASFTELVKLIATALTDSPP